MIINLHKSFCFNSEVDAYQVEYVFKNDTIENDGLQQADICLVVKYSKNQGDQIMHKTRKASSFLSQSNEGIQKLIEAQILSQN